MLEASKILEKKGYSADEIDEIICSNDDSLDFQVRKKFGLENEPVHLYEGYYAGDASEDVIEDACKRGNYDDESDLFADMDYELAQLAHEVEEK